MNREYRDRIVSQTKKMSEAETRKLEREIAQIKEQSGAMNLRHGHCQYYLGHSEWPDSWSNIGLQVGYG